MKTVDIIAVLDKASDYHMDAIVDYCRTNIIFPNIDNTTLIGIGPTVETTKILSNVATRLRYPEMPELRSMFGVENILNDILNLRTTHVIEMDPGKFVPVSLPAKLYHARFASPTTLSRAPSVGAVYGPRIGHVFICYTNPDLARPVYDFLATFRKRVHQAMNNATGGVDNCAAVVVLPEHATKEKMDWAYMQGTFVPKKTRKKKAA